MLTREAFFAVPVKLPTVEVAVPALGGSVKVRGMTVGEKDRFELAGAAAKGRGFRARVVIASAVAEDGSPLFTDADAKALEALPAGVLEPIVDAAMRLNKYTPEEVAKLEGN